jgi:ABC-2 type transport system ATP-binding protein
VEIRELLKELHRMGKTILISSHILHELAELCSSVGILERGELLFCGPVGEITRRARAGTRLYLIVNNNAPLAASLLARVEGVKSAVHENGRIVVELAKETRDYSFLARVLLEHHFQIRELKEEEVNLETAFMRLTKGVVQ